MTTAHIGLRGRKENQERGGYVGVRWWGARSKMRLGRWDSARSPTALTATPGVRDLVCSARGRHEWTGGRRCPDETGTFEGSWLCGCGMGPSALPGAARGRRKEGLGDLPEGRASTVVGGPGTGQ